MAKKSAQIEAGYEFLRPFAVIARRDGPELLEMTIRAAKRGILKVEQEQDSNSPEFQDSLRVFTSRLDLLKVILNTLTRMPLPTLARTAYRGEAVRMDDDVIAEDAVFAETGPNPREALLARYAAARELIPTEPDPEE